MVRRPGRPVRRQRAPVREQGPKHAGRTRCRRLVGGSAIHSRQAVLRRRGDLCELERSTVRAAPFALPLGHELRSNGRLHSRRTPIVHELCRRRIRPCHSLRRQVSGGNLSVGHGRRHDGAFRTVEASGRRHGRHELPERTSGRLQPGRSVHVGIFGRKHILGSSLLPAIGGRRNQLESGENGAAADRVLVGPLLGLRPWASRAGEATTTRAIRRPRT